MPDVSFLTIDQVPNKTIYRPGDKFERFGMVVTAHYTDNTTAIVDFFTYYPSGPLSISDTQITISAFDKTVTQSITVTANPSTGYFLDKFLGDSIQGENPYINTADGSVSFYNNPITIERDSYRIDLIISYHSRMTDRESDLITGFFKGFRTNFHQFLIQDGKDSNNADMYKYLDCDGYIHTFVYNGDIGRYCDKEGKGLFLNTSARTIIDSKENVFTFDNIGRLISIQNGRDPLNTKIITYSSDGIRTIYDNRNPNTYIKFSYNYSFLQYIRVYYESELLKTYTIYGFFGQISSIDEAVGNNTRTLYQYSVNDRDRINRVVDCLTKEAHRITYDFDAALNDYRFSSLRKGYVENDVFNEHQGLFFVGRKYDLNAANKLIYELVIRDSNNVHLSYMSDSNGNPVAVYECDPDNLNIYLSLNRDAGIYIPFQGDCNDSISDSQSKLFNTTLTTNEGLPSSALDSTPYIKLIGYIKINSHPKRAKFFVVNSHLKCRFIDINPDAFSVWQYFEIFIERQISNNAPVSFSSFSIKLLDENNNQINAEISNLQFIKSEPRKKLWFRGGFSNDCVDFDELQFLNLPLPNNLEETIDMFGSSIFITDKDILKTFRWKNLHPNEDAYVFLNNGKIIKKFINGFTITDIHNNDLFFFSPCNVSNDVLDGIYSWFFATSTDAPTRNYYRFTNDYYEIVTRYFPGGNNQTIEDTIVRYNYNDDMVKETNKFGSITDYEYFTDGRLKKETVTYVHNNNQTVSILYNAILDEENKYVHRIIKKEQGCFDFDYDMYFLEKIALNGVYGDQIVITSSLIEQKRDGYLSDLSRIRFLSSEIIVNEEHNYNRPSTSYKTNFIDDGVTKYRISRRINDRSIILGVYDGNDYIDVLRVSKTSVTTEKSFNNSYGNNNESQVIKETFDAYGNPNQILYNNSVMVTFSYAYNWASQYDARPETIVDLFSNRNIALTYDSNNEISSIQIGSFEVSYSSEGNSFYTKLKFSNSEEYAVTNNQDESFTKKNGNVIPSSYWKYDFDNLMRLSLKTNNVFVPSITQEYRYISSDRPNLVTDFRFNGDLYKEMYQYDSKGRLYAVVITANSVSKTVVYSYDDFGRLIGEDGSYEAFRKTFSYKKDDGMPGKVGRMEMINNTSINYDTRGRTVSFGTNTYTYDEYGNRRTKNNDTYQWTRGCLLASLGSVTFTYDYQGTRTSKTDIQGYIHQYFYEKDKLVGEDILNGNSVIRKLRYFYDKDGLCSLRIIEGNQIKDYIYIRNALNSIVGIAEGAVIKALYYYDAWGNHLVCNPDWTQNTNPAFIGNINPFRYRSYYYDSDISLYYLKTRYYDPEICQFISPDDMRYLNIASIGGICLYAYCNNNPVMYSDTNGNIAISSFLIGLAIATGIGALVGAASYVISEGISLAINGQWSWSWSQFVGSVFGGALAGALLFISKGAAVSAISAFGGFLSSVVGMKLQNIWEGSNHSEEEIFIASLINGAIAALASKATQLIRIQGLSVGRNSYSTIFKQISTKFYNGTISRISLNTFFKMLSFSLFTNLLDSAYCGITDSVDTDDYFIDWRHKVLTW